MAETTESAHGTVSTKPREDATIEQRLAHLERIVWGERERFDRYRDEMDTRFLGMDRRITDETAHREELFKSVEASLKKQAVGGADLEWMGWVITLQGTLLAGVNNLAAPWLFTLFQ